MGGSVIQTWKRRPVYNLVLLFWEGPVDLISDQLGVGRVTPKDFLRPLVLPVCQPRKRRTG